MIPVILHARCALFHGDSGNLGSVLQPDSIDAIVTDPPSGIGFMGRTWDSDKGGRDQWIAWLEVTLAPAFAALKPGGYAVVWALPRTSHWTATALENMGFEIRDVVHHLFGTGFPKGTDKTKIPVEGWNTALKPAAEHWILARKPLIGSLRENMSEFGTGAMNIDACRIGSEPRFNAPAANKPGGIAYEMSARGMPEDAEGTSVLGRWPAHVTLDESAVEELDAQSGERRPERPRAAGARPEQGYRSEPGALQTGMRPNDRGDGGGASRFFYVAKAPRKEKDAGLSHLPVRSGGEATDREEGSKGLSNPRAGGGRTGGARNFHPTVKSIALMRWLVRLVTPPGGTVLDPFAGSGTTGLAVLAEGASFIGCEAGGEAGAYIAIVKARLEDALASVKP